MAILLPQRGRLCQHRFAIAQHINIHPQERIHPFQCKYLQLPPAAIQRLWWHTKAYGTVLGMVCLRLLLWHSSSDRAFKVLPRLALKAPKLLLLVSFAAVPCISGCTKQPSANITAQPVSNVNPEKNSAVRLGYQKGGVIPISRQRGELERDLLAQNIKVEWNGPFDRCASLLQAINGNRTDIGGCGDIPSISGIAAGQALCIGAIQRPKSDSLGNAILVRGDSPNRKPADLIGKKVAVNQGGAGEYLLLKVLEKENIPKDKVQRVYLSPNDAAAALYQGSVDAWAVWEPYISLAELEHNARRITTTHPAPTYGILLVRTDAATQNPGGVKSALVALGKDAEWLNQHPQDAAKFMVKELKVSSAVAQQATKNRGPESVTFPTAEDISNLQKTTDWMEAEKMIPKRVDIAATLCPLNTTTAK